MAKKLYIALTRDEFFNEIDDPECQLKGCGANANIHNVGSCKFYLCRGWKPHKVTFQISSETDRPTQLSGANCLQLALIKWLGSVNTTKDNLNKKSSSTAPKIPQNNIKMVTSLEQLKKFYPDLLDESTVGTFPGEKYHINIGLTIQPKWQHQNPFQYINNHNLKRNSINC